LRTIKASMKKIEYKYLHWSAKVALLLLALSSFFFFYVYYRSEFVYSGLRHDTYLKYYYITFIFSILFLILLSVREKIRVNIITIIISIFVGLYLVESTLYFSGFGLQLSRYELASSQGINFDRRTKLEVVQDEKNKGADITLVVYPKTLVENGFLDSDTNILPLSGISNKKTVYCNESGKYSIYLSDRYGFNNPDSEWDKKQLNTLLLGDSFTHAACVNPGEDIASQIRKITGKSVISLGYGGNGPLSELATLREYGEIKRPKNVFWLYFERNDLVGDLNRERLTPLLMKYMQDNFSQNLSLKQSYIDAKLAEYISKKEKEYVKEKELESTVFGRIRWLRLQSLRRLIELDYQSNDVNIDPMFSTILIKAKNTIQKWNGQLYFVYLPEFSRYDNGFLTNHNSYRKREKVINVVNSLDIPVIDIHQKVFSGHSDWLSMFPLRGSGHYNSLGYSKVAESIISESSGL
jgi:hypothetical protein